jgi:hypothetical protein
VHPRSRTNVAADQAIGQPVAVHGEHLLGLLVGRPLADLPPRTSHDGAHELTAGGAEVEAETRLRQNAYLPTVEVIESLHEVLGTDDPLKQRTALSSVLPTKAALSNLH